MVKFEVNLPETIQLIGDESQAFRIGPGMDYVILRGDGTLTFIMNGGFGIKFDVDLLKMADALQHQYNKIRVQSSGQ